ncbi:hypothetical protein C8R45DRAFT_1070181 [Mycena sanguinolenta]|nr:hypothetical protein C8R45DRAFT_1070181 [Mycena sanguinolenta]
MPSGGVEPLEPEINNQLVYHNNMGAATTAYDGIAFLELFLDHAAHLGGTRVIRPGDADSSGFAPNVIQNHAAIASAWVAARAIEGPHRPECGAIDLIDCLLLSRGPTPARAEFNLPVAKKLVLFATLTVILASHLLILRNISPVRRVTVFENIGAALTYVFRWCEVFVCAAREDT